MSKIIATAAIRGAHKLVEQAEKALKIEIDKKGKDAAVAYPNTAYFLPIMLLFLGQKVQKVGDLEESLQEAKKLLAQIPKKSIVEIAFTVGFNSASSFYDYFERETNKPPGDYRVNEKYTGLIKK